METQFQRQNAIPRRFISTKQTIANSFKAALVIIQTNKRERHLKMFPAKAFTDDEKNYLKLLPQALAWNRRFIMFEFSHFRVDDILVAEALRAGVSNNNVIRLEFSCCSRGSNQEIMETMCEGLKERSTPFQLGLNSCSPEFVKSVLEASHLKCFSLRVWYMLGSMIHVPLKSLFMKGNLCYISLSYVRGLKEAVFLQLGRCLLPNLAELDLSNTDASTSALKRLHGSLQRIINSGRLNVFQKLDLGITELDDRLSFAYFQLLRSDLVGIFELKLKEDISRAVVKSISSTVAKTKNLKSLSTWNNFSSGTKFNNFTLQEERTFFRSPFGVNQTVARVRYNFGRSLE